MPYTPSSASEVVLTTDFANDFFGGGYAKNGFVQEEIMVAEMPHMAMLHRYYYLKGRGFRLKSGSKLRNLAEKGEYSDDQKRVPCLDKTGKTPALFLGPHAALILTYVPRYAQIQGIYGENFAQKFPNLFTNYVTRERVEKIEKEMKRYVKPVSPPSQHHILAIAAPYVKGKSYNSEIFEALTVPAFVGYRSARKHFSSASSVVIETGNWGAGAFGNDVRASALAQLVAAKLAGVQLAIYPYDDTNKQGWEAAIALLQESCKSLQAASKPLTPKNIFEKAQELATQKGRPIQPKP